MTHDAFAVNPCSRKRRLKFFVAVIALLLLAGAAQAQSMEERLRTQLRATAAELSLAHSQQAQLAADKAVAEQARDAAQAEAAALREQLDSLDVNNQALYQQAQDIAAEANAQIAQTKTAYDALLKSAQSKETERVQAQLVVTQLQAQAQACTAKNERLYAVGREILDAYARVGTAKVFVARQPFAAKARVKLENAAQDYGDKLYAERFDPNALAAKAPAAQAQAKATPAQEKSK